MEWGRAKSILIVSFLSLNILLGYQLWASQIELDQFNQGEAGLTEEISQWMSDQGIRLETEIPTDTPKLKEISFRFSIDTKAGTMIELDEPINRNLLTSKAEWKEVLMKQIANVGDYQLDPMASIHEEMDNMLSGTYVLNQLFETYPMFEVKLELEYRGQTINAYAQRYAEVQQGLEAKEQKVLSAITAIGSLVENNHLQYGAVITDVRLGYHGQIYNSEIQLLAPYWRVVTAKGEIYYVHAIHGGIEGSAEGE